MNKFISGTFAIATSFMLTSGAATAASETTVYFNTARHAITSASAKTLIEFAKNHSGSCIGLTAHTDLRGSVAYNQALSERRLGSVAAYLKSLSNDVNVTNAGAKSELDPAVDKEGNVQANRRVVITTQDCAAPAGSAVPPLTWLAGIPVLCLTGICTSSSTTTTTTTTTTTN